MRYRTILIDPPWPQGVSGRYRTAKNQRPKRLPYPTMTLEEIAALPIPELADTGCHLWLWTTNAFLRDGFDLIDRWGFRFLSPITWVKPSGMGNYFVSRTQVCLFAYRERCLFPLDRFRPNVIFANPQRHSQKPEESFELIEAVSPAPRLELFSRQLRDGWDSWGNEIESTITLPPKMTDGCST